MKRKLPPEVLEFFRKQGRKGGKIGGKKGGDKLAAMMTPEQRREHARKMALARWAKAKKKEKKETPNG